MYLITHAKKIVQPLTDQQIHLLKTALSPGTEHYEAQQKLLNLWREQNRWIQCDCEPIDHPKEKAIMTLRRLPSGLVIFAILPNSIAHHPDCPFYKLIRYKSYERGQTIRQKKKKTDFVFHRQVMERNIDEDKEPTPSKPSKPSMPGLQRFLYNLCHAAKTHQFSANTNLKESSYLYRLEKAAYDFTINKRFRLSDFLYFNIQDRAKAIKRLTVTANYWTGLARPHCVFLLPIDEVVQHEKTVTLKRYRHTADGWTTETLVLPDSCDLVMPGRAVVNKQNPALVALTYADISETERPFFGPAKALLMPVVSKDHLLIVESNYERVMAKCLRRLQKFLASRVKVQFYVRVVKPLEDIQTPMTHQACRPDFILEHANRKIIIEVMGSHDEEYLERKQRTVALMQEIAPVCEFDALDAEQQNQLESRSTEAAQAVFSMLLEDVENWEPSVWDELV